MKTQQLRRIFLEICAGYSEAKLQGRTIYFKHLGDAEQADLDEFEENWRARIVGLKTPTKDEKIKLAHKEGTWTEKQETAYNRKIKDLQMFQSIKKNWSSVKQIDDYFEDLRVMRAEIIVDSMPRTQAIGLCAEENASFNTYSQEINLASFADKDLTIPFFTDYDYIDDATAAALHNAYYDKVSFLRSDGFKLIKQISCQDFFSNKFWLSENAFYFLNKPLWSLSQLQTFLLSFGKRYVEVLRYCHGAPEHFYEEPEKLECYAQMVQEKGEPKNEDTGADMLAQVNKARNGR